MSFVMLELLFEYDIVCLSDAPVLKLHNLQQCEHPPRCILWVALNRELVKF